jgi:hypothetical protein
MICKFCNKPLTNPHSCQVNLNEIPVLRARVAELEDHLQTLLHAYHTGNSISTILEAKMRKAANLPEAYP